MTGILLAVPGVDVVDVREVAAAHQRFGARYLRRIHRPEELAGLADMSPARQATFLAGRFAAKEAVFKALRLPDDLPMGWTCIEIVRGAGGAPSVRLHGSARHWAHLHGVAEVLVSISHHGDCAVAMAIAQTTPGAVESDADGPQSRREGPATGQDGGSYEQMRMQEK